MVHRFSLALILIGVIALLVYIISASNQEGDPQLLSESRGYDDWDRVAASGACDVLSTTILSYQLPRSFFRSITQRTVDVARRHGVGSQRWIMGYFQEPENLDEIRDVVQRYADMGVQSLFTWTYRGGHGTVLAAPRAREVWDAIGKAYGQVLHR